MICVTRHITLGDDPVDTSQRLWRLFEDDDACGVNADHVEKLRDILVRLDAERAASDMDLPGFRLHPLRDDLKGNWAVTARANWRVLFRFADGDASDVDCVDYHCTEAAMLMKNPPHPGGFVLRECIEPMGLTITEAAEALGVTRVTLSELVNGRRGISPEMAVRLAKAFGGSAESWLVQQVQYDLAQVKAERIRVKRLEPA